MNSATGDNSNPPTEVAGSMSKKIQKEIHGMSQRLNQVEIAGTPLKGLKRPINARR